MKKFLLILSLCILSIAVYSQRSGKTMYLDADTLKGQDTVYVYFPSESGDFKSFYGLSLEIKFDQLGGTSDGTLLWEVANDSNWFEITTIEGVLNFAPNDTVTITDGGFATLWIYGNLFNKVRAKLIGTVGDTTLYKPNYIRK